MHIVFKLELVSLFSIPYSLSRVLLYTHVSLTPKNALLIVVKGKGSM
jgi:hypothetical protein